MFRPFAMSLLALCLMAQERPSMKSAFVPRPLQLTGRMDDPAWQQAVPVALTQQAPKPGEATPYPTTLRVLHGPEGLYLGFQCSDPDPSKMVTHTLQRDGDFSSDDAVFVVLETVGDGRIAYVFHVNAIGAQADGLASGPEVVSLDWDGIWETKVARDGKGWTAELFLPSRTLRFDPSRTTWVLNAERFVARDRVNLRWAAPILDAKFTDIARAGQVEGISGLHRGSGLSITPYVAGMREMDFPRQESKTRARGGLDVTVPLSDQMSAAFTYRPDFAETEADARQINLTRFDLFFPEKRAFFLEGSNLFQFGLGLDGTFNPFYSRTVGLVKGEPVTLDGGGKLLGRVGPVSVGALSVRQQATGEVDAAQLSAARVAWDVDEHFRIGAIHTRGNPEANTTNELSGVDMLWQTSRLFGDKLFAVGLWGAQASGTSVPVGDNRGWGYKIDFPNDLWDLRMVYNQFGDALDPKMGFLPRPGTKQYDAGGAYQPRPTSPSLAWIRQAYFQFGFDRVTDLQGNIQSDSAYLSPINFVTQSGDHAEANWGQERQVLTEPWEIARGVVIPLGDYRFHRYRFSADTSRTRTWQAGTSVTVGDFYGGRLTQWTGTAGWNAQDGHIRASLSTEHDFGRLPWGDFVQRLYQLKGEYAWSPRAVLSSFVQYDTNSQSLGSNLRFRWTLKPGVEAFFVWNRGWLRPELTGPLRFHPQEEIISFKLRWTFRP